MSFVTPEYILFFCVVVPLYFAVNPRFRWLFLLGVSYFFYAYWNPSYVFIIAATTLVDYWVARRIYAADEPAQKRRYLLVSLCINLGTLFFFKYFNFFNASLAGVFGALNVPYHPAALNVILPIGISFYTFQEMAYIIDVYRGNLRPEEHFGIFATFVIFFPQLVAGPIERGGNMLPQYHKRISFDYARTVEGLRLILWGFFKKVVIADRLAIYVNAVYNNLDQYSGLPLIIATLFFTFQIYCDFSGYTDIALGTAKILGIKMMDNFHQPYFARSVREFWSRWHISLSTWFRDYVYIPLGGNRISNTRTLVNLMLVFLVSGLWHGANWTFVIWGGLHGLYVVAEAWMSFREWSLLPRGLNPALKNALRWTLTFLLVGFAWIFFRANSLDDAVYVVTHLFAFPATSMGGLTTPFASDLTGAFGVSERFQFALACALIVLLLGVDYLDMRYGMNRILNQRAKAIRWLIYYAATATILILGIWGAQEFIYFQF